MIKNIIQAMRPHQWSKNFFIYAALIFSQNIFNLPLLVKTTIAFSAFCLISSALYIFNDLKDLEEDKLHPLKSKRPIASGKIKKSTAILVIIVLSLLGFSSAFTLNKNYFIIILVYFLLQVSYSIKLKHIVILDVFVVAVGFLIRVVAGGLAIEVSLSSWLLICTILLALFLALSKRRHELILLEDDASEHRPILEEYSPYLLDQMIAVVTASTVIGYCLYTISEDTVTKFGTTNLIFTVPFVLYGIFRYLYLIHQKIEGGSPEALIIKDKPLLIDIFLWITTAVIILYLGAK
ncbi:phosphoribose diphosphate:decaprenyl-phosphate phosphoribosyltransferase [candidate division WOR-1 bacterium DG_54_3]|uniref:Phosphoribose diphosphate:decaprenyl-phosphate phosphoribosyltransferase n=1 Tax=candidate division WOR-1 bacterium DG_54_3 TaxID=1703775 RepID=A0A0S7Y646_UNCSA|nr:MAG: phosphoribose diphosphate:decaprenyl-phosphate phosphoribosyltransferase [candidate division WOR-1 bacterium DG_54_3]